MSGLSRSGRSFGLCVVAILLLQGCQNPSSSVTTTPAAAVSTFSVTYNGNGNTGGSAPVDSTSYTVNSSFTVLGNTGSLANSAAFSQFGGWTGADGTAYYAVGQTLAGTTSNWTLYAAWGGVVTTLAGSGTSGSTDNANGALANFASPYGVATNGTNVYVADTTNNMIRQILISSGAVTTLAGSTASGSTNGTGAAASFKGPYGVATDGPNVYVADTGNNMIRQIVVGSGLVSTLAAGFNAPAGVATDGTYVYVADTGNNLIRQVTTPGGVVVTLAGSGSSGSADGTGTAASFNAPKGVALNAAGTLLYVADTGNNTIRQIVIATKVVTTLAGSTSGGYFNGTGTAAGFIAPIGITVDAAGNVYVADTNDNVVRKIVTSTGVVTTLAGTLNGGSANGTGLAAGFNLPFGIAYALVTGVPTLFVADSYNNLIRKIQ